MDYTDDAFRAPLRPRAAPPLVAARRRSDAQPREEGVSSSAEAVTPGTSVPQTGTDREERRSVIPKARSGRHSSDQARGNPTVDPGRVATMHGDVVSGHAGRGRRARDAAPFAGTARFPALVLGLLALAVLLLSLSVSIGAVTIPLGAVWRAIGHHLGFTGAVGDAVQERIVWTLRLPRALLAFVAGAALAVGGTVIQATVRNPLGDPYLLGIVPGASAGAVLVIVLGAEAAAGLSLGAAAFTGGVIAFLATFVLSRQGGRWPPTRLILAGVAVGYLMSAVTYYLESLADPNQLSGVLFWLLGSVSRARWPNLLLPAIVVTVSTAWLLLQGRRLNALASGEETAASLGLNVGRFQFMLMTITALLTGVVVAVAGGIGFVGLMVPHVTRLFVGADHRRVLIAGALPGGVFLEAADIAARTLQAPVELPIGIVTAAAGAPFFLWLLRSQLGDTRGR